jgi:hypothetical protein
VCDVRSVENIHAPSFFPPLNMEMYELYMNVRGEPPMRVVQQIPLPDSPISEAEVAKAFEAVISLMNAYPRERDSQFVVVQDGLIVAVEGVTSRRLLWTN